MSVFVLSACYKSRLPVTAVALLALALAGCANTAKKDSDAIVWSEPASSAPTDATSSGAPAATPPSVIPSPGAPPSGASSGAASGPSLNWHSALDGDTVSVELRDPNNHYRVERVELVGPNGVTIAAGTINRETNRASSNYRGFDGGPSVGVGGWGGSRSGGGGGITLGFPLGGRSARDREPPAGTLTTARIRLPDPVFYRQTVESWFIRITTLDRAQQSSVAIIPAPKPAN